MWKKYPKSGADFKKARGIANQSKTKPNKTNNTNNTKPTNPPPNNK
ncbi:hypothetical protein [Helicobacter sp. T3_23-1056]